MGRVYEALKRAAETNGATNGKRKNADATPPRGEHLHAVETGTTAVSTNGNGSSNGNGAHGANNGDSHEKRAPSPMPNAVPEHLLRATSFFNAAEEISPSHLSAPDERTEQLAGSALSGGQSSRVAGATLGAAGSARAVSFVSHDVSASRVEPHLVAITQPRSPHAERYRSLRTRVLHAGERKKMQAFVVTSAGVMEGKTLTSINLSWLLAQTDGVRALLIDGDLRQPCVADYLGLDARAGLSEVLAGEATLEETILRLEPAGLHLLPGGSARDNVAEILSGPKFKDLLAQVRRMFDFIVIDAPPLGIFTDASVLINRADSALIVARSGKTRYSALNELLEPLPRERLLGVVLNGADEEMNEHGYYYGKRRYNMPRDEATDPPRATESEEVI